MLPCIACNSAKQADLVYPDACSLLPMLAGCGMILPGLQCYISTMS